MESEGEPDVRRRHPTVTRVASSDSEFEGGADGNGDGEERQRRSNYSDTEDEKLPEERLIERRTKDLPKGSDRTIPYLDSMLNGLSDKWRNYVVRFIFSALMILTFVGVVWLGPMAMMILILLLQVKCYQEIISIGYAVYRVHNLPWFRSLSWYFLITSNYFFYGESLVDYITIFGTKTAILKNLTTFHRFISFCLYIIGFVWFVLSLVKRYYMRQFSLFAWTHVTLLAIVTQSYLMLQNLFNGVIWFLIPVSMVIINDIMAYLFGFFFGKTPLIKLSPKKTWEGFIGGGISTVILGALLSHFLCQFQYFVCPIAYDSSKDSVGFECTRSWIFEQTEYKFNPDGWVGAFWVFCNLPVIRTYPFVLHSVALSLFSSSIGPFGGFFASGFKRAFKIKDFGDVIPGHGGIVDRFDCQVLMATFVNVYYHSFIKSPDEAKLISQISLLGLSSQVKVFKELAAMLANQGLLSNSTSIEQIYNLNVINVV